MNRKRLVCAVVAFLMVGVNMAGAMRVFADEVNEEPVGVGEVVEADEGGIGDADESDEVGGDGGDVIQMVDERYAMVGDTVQLRIIVDGDLVGESCYVAVNDGVAATGVVCNVDTAEVEVYEPGIYYVTYVYMINQGDMMVQRMHFARIFAFDVAVDGTQGGLDTEDAERVRSFVGGQLKALMISGEIENEYLTLDEWARIWRYLNGENVFTVVVESRDLPEEEWGDGYEARDEVLAQVHDGEVIAGVKVVYMEIYAGEFGVGLVYGLDAPVTMRYTLPEAMTTAPAGYRRVLRVIRGHMSVDYVSSAARLAMAERNGVYEFENDRFSSFTFVYEDILEEPTESVAGAPNTGAMRREGGSASGDVAAAVFTGLVVVLAFGVVKFVKR